MFYGFAHSKCCDFMLNCSQWFLFLVYDCVWGDVPPNMLRNLSYSGTSMELKQKKTVQFSICSLFTISSFVSIFWHHSVQLVAVAECRLEVCTLHYRTIVRLAMQFGPTYPQDEWGKTAYLRWICNHLSLEIIIFGKKVQWL